jgi:hypothetical protein
VLTGPGVPNVVAAEGVNAVAAEGVRAGAAIVDVLAVVRPLIGEFAVAGRGRDGILGCPGGGLGGEGSCGRTREWWCGCFGGRRGAAEAGTGVWRRPTMIVARTRAATGTLRTAVRGDSRGDLTCWDLIWRSAYL